MPWIWFETQCSVVCAQVSFRKLSLLIHPDKNSDPRASQAFQVPNYGFAVKVISDSFCCIGFAAIWT
jgi:hypothetical protein